MNSRNGIRQQHGQSMIVLVIFIAVFVLLVAGVFGFEMNRMEVARQQLRTATEAAALAGAATLASSDNTNPSASQNAAIATAINSFQKNSIIGISLASAQQTYSSPATPSPQQALLYVQLLDPNNNNQPVSIGDPNGKIVEVTSFFGLTPAFGQFVGIGNVTLDCHALGGVPSLDVVVCFDVSASIDDQTPVTFVRRVWNGAQGKTNYIVASTSNGAPAGALAEGTIFSILGPPPTGTPVDGVYPQNLDMANYPGEHQYPLNWSEVPGRNGSAVGLRGRTETGVPPGNYPGQGQSNTGNAQTFTDLVVNIDGKTTFGGYTYGQYSFPDLATLVEAARGNLENQTVFVNSKASVSVPSSVKPIAGYKAAYEQMALLNSQPISAAQQACQTFFQIMNTDTDAHFSLAAFTTNAGTASNTSYRMENVDPYWTSAGVGNFPCPLIVLNPATLQTNYNTVLSVLPTLGPVSGTNIGDAINTAVNQLKNNGRKGATKAIVLFTDGEPTVPSTSTGAANARSAAVAAKDAGIPIYSIGLAQTPTIIPSETAILTDQNSNPSNGGVSGIAGHGGKFFLVTNQADLSKTFENIARQLVALVR